MIDLVPLLKIAPIFAVALVIPGPDFMMISSTAISRGRISGMRAALGIATCSLLWIVSCMFGLGYIFARMEWLMIVIRLCGGIYLVYLGYQLWKSSLKRRIDYAESKDVLSKQRNPFIVGFLTNLTNPKAIAFFTSIFAVTMPQHATFSTQIAIMGMMGFMSAGWFSFVSLCLSAPAMRKAYMRWSRWIDRIAGTFMAFFGARLLTSFRN